MAHAHTSAFAARNQYYNSLLLDATTLIYQRWCENVDNINVVLDSEPTALGTCHMEGVMRLRRLQKVSNAFTTSHDTQKSINNQNQVSS